jgi:hypothetical protein
MGITLPPAGEDDLTVFDFRDLIASSSTSMKGQYG